MCNYWHGGTIECRGDGYMWDADCDGYDPEDVSMPCPACNTMTWFESAKENGESISYSSGYWGSNTGVDMWRNAVTIALRANPEMAPKLLRKMGTVRPIMDHPTDRAECIEVPHDCRNERFLVSRRKREGTYISRSQSTPTTDAPQAKGSEEKGD